MTVKDDHYRLIGIYFLIVLTLLCWLVGKCTDSCSSARTPGDTVTIERTCTVYTEVRDTIPVEKWRRTLEYVNIAASLPCDSVSRRDSITALPVVQKAFSDDSTYTAYVSGIQYDSFPKLDSIAFMRREVVRFVTRTVTASNNRRWHFGVQGGVGITPKGVQPYIGVGATYTW